MQQVTELASLIRAAVDKARSAVHENARTAYLSEFRNLSSEALRNRRMALRALRNTAPKRFNGYREAELAALDELIRTRQDA